MSLDTVLHASLARPQRPVTSLVLMGGGARTAYQVGVLRCLATLLRLQPSAPTGFPFRLLVGTSAGAINAACLASFASLGLDAFDRLASFWDALRSEDVYRLQVARWARLNKFLVAWKLSRYARNTGAILDNLPLVDTLHNGISLHAIEQALQQGALDALAVTASSYSSGVHWTFCHTRSNEPLPGWSRPGRRAEYQPITIEHLIASAAIPFLFPSTTLYVNGQAEHFGDGSMRQVSPLSPALHLGAQKVMVVGAGQPQRSGMGQATALPRRRPTLGNIAGHALASVFHDTLQADVEQTVRVSQTLRRLPRETAAALPYRHVDVLSIQPSGSLDALALQHLRELPPATHSALSALGVLRGGGGALTSYLLFEPGFVRALISMGESDAYARKEELLAFFADE